MTVAERLTRNGYTVEIVYDQDCTSPRENENVGLFLGFPHRNYNIGDEKFDPTEYSRTCTTCQGQGTFDTDKRSGGFIVTEDCETCKGAGEVRPKSEAELMEWLKEDHGATVVLKVGMYDHSGVSYYIGGGTAIGDSAGWDSGTCGFILDTKENRDRLGIEGFTVEQITEALTGEIKEYDAWATGECYGIVVKDLNGDVVESCWGFIGTEYVKEAVDDYVPTEPPPAKKYAVMLTDDELALAGDALMFFDERADFPAADAVRAIAAKITAARPKVEE